jgi:hypothetical protein
MVVRSFSGYSCKNRTVDGEEYFFLQDQGRVWKQVACVNFGGNLEMLQRAQQGS